MKDKKAFVLLPVLLLAATVNLLAQALPLPRLAVVTFAPNNTAPKTQQDAITVRNLVESQMVATGKYQVIARNEIDSLLTQQRIAVSAISSMENIKKLQLMNISYIVTGSVDAMGADYAITMKILDVSSGKFSHSDNEYIGGGSRELYTGVNALVKKFIGGMFSGTGGVIVQEPPKAPPPPAPAPVQQPARIRYKIGDTGPGGGIVFAVEGNTGMEVSRLLGDYSWDETITAAKNYKGGGKSDWYLPSKGELNLIYENLKKAGILNIAGDEYWSSSQDRSNYAWYQRFSDGVQTTSPKNYTFSVRAVRAF